MKKKIFSTFLSLAAAAGIVLVPNGLVVKSGALTYGVWEYGVNAGNTTVTITKYTGAGGDIVIPSKIDGKAVTVLGVTTNIFENASVSSVVLPDSITSIGEYAFNAQKGNYVNTFNSITIPENVKTIGKLAFRKNDLLTSVWFKSMTPPGLEMYETTWFGSGTGEYVSPFAGCAGDANNEGVGRLNVLVPVGARDAYVSLGKFDASKIVEVYSVKFNLNGGEGDTPEEQAILPGGNIVKPANPTRSGYAFIGWYTESSGKNEFNTGKGKVNKNLTLYAKWEKIPAKPSSPKAKADSKSKITLTWKTVSGASGYEIQRATSSSGSYKKVTTITSNATAKWENTGLSSNKKYYYKIRAYKNVDGKKVYGSYTSVISAKTEKEYFTVTFDINGGSGKAPAKQSIASSGKISKPSNPRRSGYTFVGWYTEKSGKNVWNVSKDKVNKNTTLYAKWEKTPDKPKSLDANADSKSKITLTWGRISGASGYEIYRASTVSGNYKKVKTVSKGSTVKWSNEKLSSDSNYFYKVRAYKTVDGKKIYSDYTAVVSARTKK
ncbi:MAG: InlB B-repeat-containing protein [Oscillospiraceae bacterium]|jgi:uncharacterized repeat protein (TIGR02543 family)|nr:InlB B-repeat-containing protein [Oscillospiraceae bacterium]